MNWKWSTIDPAHVNKEKWRSLHKKEINSIISTSMSQSSLQTMTPNFSISFPFPSQLIRQFLNYSQQISRNPKSQHSKKVKSPRVFKFANMFTNKLHKYLGTHITRNKNWLLPFFSLVYIGVCKQMTSIKKWGFSGHLWPFVSKNVHTKKYRVSYNLKCPKF